jgi:hypothetical protein
MAYLSTAAARQRPGAVRARTARAGRRPGLERLESRELLYATGGGMWQYPIRVTYSLVPDGTSIGGTPSNLFGTMNAVAPTATWEAQIARAAAAWNAVAGVNLVPVVDDGSPIGSGSLQQGASNIGDIRIGAMPEPSGELAFAFLPPPTNGGSASADLFFNSNAAWGSGGYDLTSVALHEIGHALGLEHSSYSTAVMYADYTGVKTGLTSDDVAGIQAVYGPIPSTGHTSAASAAPVALASNGTATVTGVQVASASDQDWYSVVIPPTTNGTLTVIAQSSQLSALEPRLAIYNASVHGLALASATTYGGTAGLQINNVSPGQTYYLRVTANTSGPGSAGAYGMTVATGTATPSPVPVPNTAVATQANGGDSSAAESTGGSTGGGGLLGGLLGVVTNTLSAVVGTLDSLLDGKEHLIQVGSLQNWAEAYSIRPGARFHHAGRPHPHGPGATLRPFGFASRTL